MIMARHTIEGVPFNWDDIAADFERQFTPIQLMNRVLYRLRPALASATFNVDERRTILKLGLRAFGDWTRISRQMRFNRKRSPAQLRVVLAEMLARLEGMDIRIEDPNQVDLIPDLFFQATVSPTQTCQIQMEFAEGVRGKNRREIEEENVVQ
jgi:hypothetical protein